MRGPKLRGHFSLSRIMTGGWWICDGPIEGSGERPAGPVVGKKKQLRGYGPMEGLGIVRRFGLSCLWGNQERERSCNGRSMIIP